MDYIIKPYTGVNNLFFGMTRNDAHLILGPPARSRKSRFSNELTDYWHENGVQLAFDLENMALVEISLYPNIGEVKLNDIVIFGDNPREILERLCLLDGRPMETVGVTILLHLGLALTGFLHEERGDQSITAFVKGRWNEGDLKLRQQ